MRMSFSSLRSSLLARAGRAGGSRRGRRARGAQQGMTLLEIMIVLAILALIMGLVVGPRVMKLFGKSKENIAAATVQKFANEAYPLWSQANPDKACPADIAALAEHMNSKDVNDTWGQPYRLLCGPTAPPGVQGIGVISNGPDQKQDTPDDIKSW
jgi:prepilin-type N-terminal cleavage/methylation domain-containing protein